MNANSIAISDTASTPEVENNVTQPASVFEEIVTLSILFLATSAITLLLTLSWVL